MTIISSLTKLWILWATILTSLARYVYGYHSGMKVNDVTNLFLNLNLEPAPWEEVHARYYKSGQDSMAGEVIGSRRENLLLLFC